MKLFALAPLAIKAQKCVQCTWTKDITTGERYFGLDDVPDLPGFPGELYQNIENSLVKFCTIYWQSLWSKLYFEGNDPDISNLTKDARCFDSSADDEFTAECERGANGARTYCFNEATMEWRPTGAQIIKITRGCRALEWADRCEAQTEWGYFRNDCHMTYV